ncbi:MAG: ABC transporter substrate-binding protein, partial [Chloroflexota bacterium]|nr:ABC transporter substrate-binding protein [Chloroflexota bacterium]
PWLLAGAALALVAAVAAGVLLQPRGLAGEPYLIAYAGPLSGPDAYAGREQVRAIELAVETINQQGGIGGRPVDVVSFDDRNDPATVAAVAAEIVANDQVWLVIGHQTSEASLIAAPIYEAARIVAISPSATADSLNDTHPWYFRSVLANREQGKLVAAYSQHVLDFARATVISTGAAYETSLAAAFRDGFNQAGTVVAELAIEPEDRESSIAAVVAELAALPDPGLVFLSLVPEDARDLLLVLRRAGLNPPIIGGDALGYQGFAQLFAGEPEELEQPGFFTNGLRVTAPLIYDSLGGEALTFSQRFRASYGVAPQWFGAKAYDAAILAIHALDGAAAGTGNGAIEAGRARVRDALDRFDSPETAVPGLSGPLYFDADRSVPQLQSFGRFDRGVLLSALVQYRAVTDPTQSDLAADRAAGLIYDLDGLILRQYRVAYVGVDLIEVSNLDARAQTFDADFFLWFRYAGDDLAVDISFTNTTEPDLPLPEPLNRSELNDNHFVMYRVKATFTDPMDFHDYPWDTHLLTIGLQNVRLSEDDIVYVPDQATVGQSAESRLRSAVDYTQPFNQIPSWVVDDVSYVQGTASARTTTPDPRTSAPEYDSVSTFQVQMSYAREVRSFLIKNLLPLALLALVTYISLFFSVESAGTRIGFSVTSILTTSVLLQSISSNLPEIGYTVAIEWGYYVYIALSALLVLINIVIDRWYKQKRFAAVRQLDLVARVLYPTVILIVVAVYVVRFH